MHSSARGGGGGGWEGARAAEPGAGGGTGEAAARTQPLSHPPSPHPCTSLRLSPPCCLSPRPGAFGVPPHPAFAAFLGSLFPWDAAMMLGVPAALRIRRCRGAGLVGTGRAGRCACAGGVPGGPAPPLLHPGAESSKDAPRDHQCRGWDGCWVLDEAPSQSISAALPWWSKRLSERPRAGRRFVPGSSEARARSACHGGLFGERSGGKAAPGAQQSGTGETAPSASPVGAGVSRRVLSRWCPGDPEMMPSAPHRAAFSSASRRTEVAPVTSLLCRFPWGMSGGGRFARGRRAATTCAAVTRGPG